MKCSINNCDKEAMGIAYDYLDMTETFFCKEHFDLISILRVNINEKEWSKFEEKLQKQLKK
jgi:hypothetical protein